MREPDDSNYYPPGGPVPEHPVEQVRTFANGNALGVGNDDVGRYWVYDCPAGRVAWHKHTGPFSTWQEAADWCEGIRDTADAGRQGGKQ